MTPRIKIKIVDEVNCVFEGLTVNELKKIIKETEIPVKGAFMSPAFKTKNWNGKESLFDPDGVAFQYMIPQVVDILIKMGVNIDRDIELVDEREVFVDLSKIDKVDENFLENELGFKLREHQISIINSGITEKTGIFDAATNAGKSAICLALSKKYDGVIPSLIIVPSEYLANQTYAVYKKSNLNVSYITKDIKPKDRKKVIEDSDHIVITSKLFLNCKEYFVDKPYVLLVDEVHQFGEMLANAIRSELRNCPVRIGMSGSIPKDRFKKEFIFCHFNGGIIDYVGVDYLTEKGYAAKTDIKMFITEDLEIDLASQQSKKWSWDLEYSYLSSNKNRIRTISEFIKSFDLKNSLILCHPEFGKQLVTYFDTDFICDETPQERRIELLNKFDTEDDAYVFASFGTTGTGVSKDRIYRLIIIDIGKNDTYIKQGIGRAIRLDGVYNEVDVIDISSDTKYSKIHRRDRIKLYKADKHQFEIIEEKIKIR